MTEFFFCHNDRKKFAIILDYCSFLLVIIIAIIQQCRMIEVVERPWDPSLVGASSVAPQDLTKRGGHNQGSGGEPAQMATFTAQMAEWYRASVS